MWRRFLERRGLRRRRPGYHSRFGGLWTDRTRASEELEERLRSGALEEDSRAELEHWIRHGYVVFPGAVPAEEVDRYRAELAEVWDEVDRRYQVEIDGVYSTLSPELRSANTKLVDAYVHSELARRLAFSPRIATFLRRVFERDILLFQSLSFERGSEQFVHQDTAYVVVSSPMELAASWIALEDVQPGSGELVYYPGSHRYDEFLFKSGARNWNRQRDGDEVHMRYRESLHEQAAERGLELERFTPRKGDVLMWSADLAHGGSAITRPGATRQSLVCHYCPADVRPYYFSYKADRRGTREHAPGQLYASSNYDLA